MTAQPQISTPEAARTAAEEARKRRSPEQQARYEAVTARNAAIAAGVNKGMFFGTGKPPKAKGKADDGGD